MATEKNPWDKYCFIDELPFKVIDRNLPVSNCRHINIKKDKTRLKELVTEFTFRLFGNVDILKILWNNCCAMCIEDSAGQPVAFVCLSIYPNLLSVPTWDWENWVEKLYGLHMLNSSNTLWVHLLVWQDEHRNNAIGPLIESVFLDKMFIEYVVMVVPPFIRDMGWAETYATKIFPKEVTTRECMTLYLFCASRFFGSYTFRMAVEDDNDDVMALIGNHTKRLTKKYGNYVIAELLSQHKDCGRQIVVAEKNDQTVGVVILNEVVNYELLYKELELAPFFGLQKVGNEDLTRSDYFKCADYDDENCAFEENVYETEKGKSDHEDINFLESKDDNFGNGSQKSDSDSETFSLISISSLHLDLSIGDIKEPQSLYSAAILERDFSRELCKEKGDSLELNLNFETTKSLTKDKMFGTTSLMEGDPNAFTIEVFAISPHDERIIAIPLLRACFECFPDRDLAVLCSPANCYYRDLLRFFIQPPPRRVTTFGQNVYILHRDRMNATPSVRKARTEDYDAIEEMTRQMMKRESLLRNYYEAVTNTRSDLMAYVLVLNKQKIIGVAVLRPEKDVDSLREKYDLSKACRKGETGPTGVIEHLLISAVFGKMAAFFLRELHRVSDFSLLVYYLHLNDLRSKERQKDINNVLNLMVSVRIKKNPEKIAMDLEKFEDMHSKKNSTSELSTRAMFISTMLLCSRDRYDVNLRIVAVGASETCLAFLEALLCTWDPAYSVSFTNVTIISPHGFATSELDYPNSSRKLMFPNKSSFHEREALMITIRCRVNQVFGVMTAIDRKNKVLMVNNNSYINYDFLYILCGEQFQKPSFDPTNVIDRHKEAFPENVYIVNTETDAGYALYHLRKLINERESTEESSGNNSEKSKASVPNYHVIVYGCALEVYCCVTALMDFGVPGKNIILIEPPRAHNSGKSNVDIEYQEQFDDGNVLDAIINTMVDSKINYYCDTTFTKWSYDPSRNLIKGAHFRTKQESFYKSCIAMFYYSCKSVSYRTFQSVTRAGLVFDGGIVINAKYETNDPFIYAAGTITKYSRKYYAEHLAHRYFNLEEVGFDLGIRAKNKFMADYGIKYVLDENIVADCEDDQTVRVFKKPLLTYCKLPGGLQYMNISKPGKKVNPEISKSLNQYGQDLVTGNCNLLERQGYFRIHLNVHDTVESVTCLSLSDIDKNNLSSLWGKHEKMLNKLLTRYGMGLIKDLFEYFRQPWAAALYQDDFTELDNKIYRILNEKPSNFLKKTLTENIIELHRANKWIRSDENDRSKIDQLFMSTEYPKLIEGEVVKHIMKHRSTLPMYFNEVEYALQKPSSPMFDPK